MSWRFEDTEMDENPATIAYAIIALLGMTFDFSLVVVDDQYGDEQLVALDLDTGHEYFRLAVSPMMGVMLCSILELASTELTGQAGEGPWISKH